MKKLKRWYSTFILKVLFLVIIQNLSNNYNYSWMHLLSLDLFIRKCRQVFLQHSVFLMSFVYLHYFVVIRMKTYWSHMTFFSLHSVRSTQAWYVNLILKFLLFNLFFSYACFRFRNVKNEVLITVVRAFYTLFQYSRLIRHSITYINI